MKTVRLSIIAIGLSSVLLSCLKEQQPPEPIIDPVWPATILLWSGEDTLITIENFPKLSKVTSENEEVVKAELQDNGIRLSAGAPGSTRLMITGEANRTATREVRSMNLRYE